MLEQLLWRPDCAAPRGLWRNGLCVILEAHCEKGSGDKALEAQSRSVFKQPVLLNSREHSPTTPKTVTRYYTEHFFFVRVVQ